MNVANRDGMQKSKKKKELQLLSVREDASGPFHVGTFDWNQHISSECLSPHKRSLTDINSKESRFLKAKKEKEGDKKKDLFLLLLFVSEGFLDMSSVSCDRPLARRMAPARSFVCPWSALCETSGIEE